MTKYRINYEDETNEVNSNVWYAIANYFTTDDELVNCFRLYNTEGLVLANYDIQDMEVPTYLGADQVLTTVANQLDVEVDDYYKWLYNSQDTLVASNRYISIDKQKTFDKIQPLFMRKTLN